MTMYSGRFLSLLLLFCTVLLRTTAITTTHHDKPEKTQPLKMAANMHSDITPADTLSAAENLNSTKLESAERQKRLLPYMTFYLEQDFNRPHGHPQPQIQHPSAPQSQLPSSGFATTGAIKQPTILQQYHNKFTELTNGISYQPATKFVQVNSDKIRLTPFSNSNALPGPFLPMRNPPNVIQPNVVPVTNIMFTSSNSNNNNKQPNYSAIYDKLSQLKLHQQYQQAQTYSRHYPPQGQHVQQLKVHLQPVQMHAHNVQPQNYIHKPQSQQHQPQQVSYIPIRDFIRVQNVYKPIPHKTIVQTYTPSSIEIEPQDDHKHGNIDEGNVLAEEEQSRYEHSNTPVKSFNEPGEIKSYPLRIHQVQEQYSPDQKDQYEIKKHALNPVLVLRQKQTNKQQQPYLILQRKPTQQKQPFNIQLQIQPDITYRPAKYPIKYQQREQDEGGKIVVESVTPKYIDIVPNYEVKSTILPYLSTSYEKYKYNEETIPSGVSAPSGPPRHQIVPVPPVPIPPTPQPHIISYQRPTDYTTSNAAHETSQEHYMDSEQPYQKPPHSQVELEYVDSEDEEAPSTTKPPSIYYGKYYSQVPESASYITTPKPTYQTKAVVLTPTIPAKTEDHEPQYQEGSNSLSLILKKLQDTNALPQTLTPDNIDNSIRTLVKILSSLKKQPKFQKPIVVQDDSLDYNGNNEAGVELGEVPGTVTQIFPENTPEGGTPGTPGVDYPALSTIPQTNFNCKTQRYKGFFGDPDTHCQVWHYCDLNGGQASFLCPNGTIFSQVALTCDWWYNVKCSNTAQLYVLNERLYKYILPLAPKFPEDYSGPLVDRYIALKFQEMEEKMKKERKKNKENSNDQNSQDFKTSSETRSQENETVQDDAEELRREKHRHEQTSKNSSAIVVPDESNETSTSVETENSQEHDGNENHESH